MSFTGFSVYFFSVIETTTSSPPSANALRRGDHGIRLPLPPGYADQPYIVVLPDGAWVCVATSADGNEGDPSQGVMALRSEDRGETWSEPTRLEAPEEPENSYAVALATPGGRIYAFYNYNHRNLREVRREDGGVFSRVDSLGQYVFRYSDDGGRTWSDRRYPVPVREFRCDRENIYGGEVRFFWNVGRPCVRANGEVVIPHHKVGAIGNGFLAESEGAFIASQNILTESDPQKIVFETLPAGDEGLKPPEGGGRVAEEHSLVELSDGSLYTVYRGVAGYPVCAYSRDGGRTWAPPEYKTFTPGGRRMKNPRAANFVWKCANGYFLYWFHHHGGPFIRRLGNHASLPNGLSPVGGRSPYDDRNPVWLCAGKEVDGPGGRVLAWSQPEIFLYHDDPVIRMSYPDMVEQDGRIWITETNKTDARIHPVPPDLLRELFAQLDDAEALENAPTDTAWTERPVAADKATPWTLPLPKLARFDAHSKDPLPAKDSLPGCTLELVLEGQPRPGEVLFDSRNDEGAGIRLRALEDGRIEALLSDARTTHLWPSDPGDLRADGRNHIALLVDNGPKLIVFVINGRVSDGGEERQFGWGRYNPNLVNLEGTSEAQLAASVAKAALHPHALRVGACVRHAREVIAHPS